MAICAQNPPGGYGPSSGGSGTGANTTSSTFGGSPSNAYTFSVVAGTTYATNNKTGNVDYSGADATVVINSAIAALATTGGRLFFKNGVYPINSMTLESATGCSNFGGSGAALAYGIHFPANTVVGSVQWLIEGESTSVWQGEIGSTTVNANGVVFNVTSTAVSSVTAGSVLAGFWQSPNTNCTLTTAFPNVSNDLHFHNITVRFPTTTRGNEIGVAAYFALNVEYDNVVADFNLAYNTIATGATPTTGTYGSFGLTSTVSGSGNWQDFRNTFAVGYNIGYDFLSEHVTGTTITSIYNNNACEFGRVGSASVVQVFHPIAITHFVDQETGAGCIWGPGMSQGTITDIFFDFELGNDANWYTTARGKTTKLTETNCGYDTGILRYQTVLENTGIVAEIPVASLFTSCGQNFQAFEGTSPPSISLSPITDSFTRPNSPAPANTNGLGPAWLSGTQVGNNGLTIASNAAQINSASASVSGYSFYLAQTFNSDQFSKATVGAINSSASTFFEVATNGSTSPSVQTYNTYYCSHLAAGGSGIIKVVAGASTTLASQTAVVGCNAGDVLELRSIGGLLWAYRNGNLDTNFSPNPVATTVSGGAPGLFLFQSAAAGVTATTWSGGSFPTMHGTDSIYSNPDIHPMYLSSGTAPTPTGTGACATITTQVPASIGSQAGSLKCTGTTGASTITLTFPAAQAAPNGWRCSADDETTVADRPSQTSSTTTTCVLTTTSTATNDVIVWNASPF